MIRASTLPLAICFVASSAAASGTQASDLIVGSVRDANGRPIAGASIRATDAAQTFAGQDYTDELGTFAVHLVGAVAALEIRCAHCRSERITAVPGANLSIVVTRYAALESDLPDASDLAALPYGRIVDALGLVPFVLPAAGGATVSDRGLGGGRGLVSDDGAALADLATGASALINFPDRSVRQIAITRANDAFRYGPYAAGGIFALDTFGDTSEASLDTGAASGVALAPVVATLHPSLAVSDDAGVLARRGDLDVATPFAGGALRAGLTDGSELIDRASLATARDVGSARLAYATASRRYRTFVDAATSRVVVAGSGAMRTDYASAYSDGGFRLEYPGRIALAAGVRAAQQSARYEPYPALPSALDGRANSLTSYLEAHAGSDRTRVDVGVGSIFVSASTAFGGATARANERALLPSLRLRQSLGGGFYARAGYSESSLFATPLEGAAQPLRTAATGLERGELLDSAVGFDAGGRLRWEGIAYREFARGGADRRLDGVGASIAWQISPLISVRAWSLRTSPLDFATQPYSATLPASRQVAWLSFDRREALRIDAVVHRDVGADRRAVVALDGDVLVPIVPHVAIDFSTYLRAGVRGYAVGLRRR